MTNIEQKALELCNEVQAERNHAGSPWNSPTILNEALYRAIEQHERFRQEVSDEIAKLGCWPDTINLQRFIIANPDPLVEALHDMDPDCRADADNLRAALAKRGLEIREKSDG